MKWLAALLTFALVTVLASLAAGFAFGLHAPGAWIAFALAAVAAALVWRRTEDVGRPPLNFWDYAVFAVFALVSLRAFLWVIYEQDDDIRVLSPNNLGDMSLHLNFIRYLAGGVRFWPESPILAGVPLTYPLGADLFNSALEVCRISTIHGLVWTGLAGAALSGFALWRWGGPFGVCAFLFNGGLAGFVFLRTLVPDDFQKELVWKNLFLAMFVTQRGLLFALPAGLLILIGVRERFFRSGRMIVPWGLQLALYASMPLFNLHAFLFLSLVLLAVFITLLWQKRRADGRRLGLFVGCAILPATAFIVMVTGRFSTKSGWGWLWPGTIMGNEPWTIWFTNFGLSLPLIVVLVVLCALPKRRMDAETRCFAWTAFVVFVAACIYRFAPWEWDNTKLMMWSWLVLAPYLWEKIIKPFPSPARGALCFALFFSGAVSLAGGLDLRHGYGIGFRSEIDAWRAAVAGIPPGERFACVPAYNHPLILLGRKVACGYDGHLMSHGLDYQEKYALLNSALNGSTSWARAAPALKADWLALRQSDLASRPAPADPPPGSRWGVLYDLREFRPGQSSPEPRQWPRQSVGSPW